MILRPPYLFGEILHIIFPSSCPACGRLAVPFCEECLNDAASQPPPPFCAECGGPYGRPCCYGGVPCYAAAFHEGAARDFILALKYRNMRALGFAMGARMSKLAEGIEADCIVPLPLHKGSRRAYNQTELLARGIASRRELDVEARAMSWAERRAPQSGRNAAERAGVSVASFRVSERLRGKRVILVDDVYTTGGTARAAIAALRKAGAVPAAVMLWSRRTRGSAEASDGPEEPQYLL